MSLFSVFAVHTHLCRQLRAHDDPQTEQGVPGFDGTFSKYKSSRRRACLFKMEKRIEKRGSETLVCLMSGLTKEAWDC